MPTPVHQPDVAGRLREVAHQLAHGPIGFFRQKTEVVGDGRGPAEHLACFCHLSGERQRVGQKPNQARLPDPSIDILGTAQ